MLSLPRVALSLAMCFLLAGPALAGASHPPLLTLAYTANTMGMYQACPVCGQNAQGGLDRRATIFKDLRAQAGDRALFISGPFEFAPMVQRKAESPELARALAQAFGRLGYDLGAVAPREAEWLAASGAALPGAWRTLGNQPGEVVIERPGLKVGVVLFPVCDEAAQNPGQEAFAQVTAAAVRLRARSDLVVGVSSWGEKAEGRLLDAAAGVFDVLLGSGQGMGQGVRVIPGGGTIWVRPPFDGRGVSLLQVLELPGYSSRQWREGKEFQSNLVALDQKIRSDPEIANIFSWL